MDEDEGERERVEGLAGLRESLLRHHGGRFVTHTHPRAHTHTHTHTHTHCSFIHSLVHSPQTAEQNTTQEIYRKFQGILNKLTPQKFQALAEQALQLEINTEERLRGVIDKMHSQVQ